MNKLSSPRRLNPIKSAPVRPNPRSGFIGFRACSSFQTAPFFATRRKTGCSSEKAKHDLIVRSVEDIMKAKAKLAESRNDSDVEFWRNKCEKLESDINTAVYSLYDLTQDEIKLIENG